MPKKGRAAPIADDGEMIVPEEMQEETQVEGTAPGLSTDTGAAVASDAPRVYRVLASMIQIRTEPVFPNDDNLRLRGAEVRGDEFESPELEARYLELGAIETVEVAEAV